MERGTAAGVRANKRARENFVTAGLKGKAEGSWGSGQESYGPDQRKTGTSSGKSQGTEEDLELPSLA